MAEAAIGFAMMVCVWILIVFSCWLSNNHIRAHMASRHAAWALGEGGAGLTKVQIDEGFFYDPDFTQVTYEEGVGMASIVSDVAHYDRKGVGLSGGGPNIATVSFGLDALTDSKADRFPYLLLKVKAPFMPSAPDTADFLKLKSSCQWDDTGDPWANDSGLSVLDWVQSKLLKSAGSLAKTAGL